MRLQHSYRPDWAEWANLTKGGYILRTNIGQWTDEALWQTYIQLTEAEAAFRVQKCDLAMRPMWHHKAERIKAHILICFIAYALWKTASAVAGARGLRTFTENNPRGVLAHQRR